MSTFGKVFKDEVVRLSRKEIRSQIEPLRKASVAYRHEIAELKRQIASQDRQVKTLARMRTSTPTPPDGAGPTRFVAKGLRSLRTRLGLSAEGLAVLVGVSGQSLRNWEDKKSTPGKVHRATLAGLRSIGKREAQARLEKLRPKRPKARSPAKK
jgi:DNA-binding transcriptional regulator YiaG